MRRLLPTSHAAKFKWVCKGRVNAKIYEDSYYEVSVEALKSILQEVEKKSKLKSEVELLEKERKELTNAISRRYI
ncbi:hypothetical protein M0804_009549 [Polistes exclamans]|nr:hypothetical protein M0804_009549 [Polistes exclamans]